MRREDLSHHRSRAPGKRTQEAGRHGSGLGRGTHLSLGPGGLRLVQVGPGPGGHLHSGPGGPTLVLVGPGLGSALELLPGSLMSPRMKLKLLQHGVGPAEGLGHLYW